MGKSFFSAFLIWTGFFLLTSCKAFRGNSSDVKERFDPDIERIDLGRGIFESTGEVAGQCLIIGSRDDIIPQHSFIRWKQIKPESAQDEYGNPTVKLKTSDVPLNPNQFYWQISLVTKSYELKKLLEVSAAAQYSGAVASVSASGRFANSVQMHEENVYFLLDVYILTNSMKINVASPSVQLEKAFIPAASSEGRDRAWYNSCGNAVITEVVYGARRVILLELQGYTKEHITTIESQMKGRMVSGSGSISLSQQIEEVVKSNSLNVKGMQLGGQLSSISGLMSVDGIIKNTETWIEEVQKDKQWVPIAYYSDLWSNVGKFKEMQSASELSMISGKNFEIDSYSNTYSTLKDLQAYLNFALSKPYQMVSTADPRLSNGRAVPGLTSGVKERIVKLNRKITDFLQRIEQMAAVCAREKASSVSMCDSENDLEDRAEMPLDAIESDRRPAWYKAKKYVDTLRAIEEEKDALGLSTMAIPEYKEHEKCAELGEKFATTYKMCEHQDNGVESHKVGTGEVCGIAEYVTETAERCGVATYKMKHDCKICGQSGTFGGCKKCESSAFGPDTFKECPVEPLVAKSYRSCAHPSFGTTFVKARHKDCGLEHHAKCIILDQGNGVVIPIDPDEYYKKTFAN